MKRPAGTDVKSVFASSWCRRAVMKIGVGAMALVPALSRSATRGALDEPCFPWRPLQALLGDTLVAATEVNGRATSGIIDSGSGASVLDRAFAAALGLRGEKRTISGLATRTVVELVENVSIVFGGERRMLPFVIIGDLSAMSAAVGTPLDVLLGADLFAERGVAIDYSRRRYAVVQSGSFVGGRGWTSVPISRGDRQELLIPVSLNGGTAVPMMVDTGNASGLMVSADYAEKRRLLADRRTSNAALGGLDGIHEVGLFTTDRLMIAGIDIRSIPSLKMDRWASTSAAGNVGLPVVGQFVAVFDVSRQQLWLSPVPKRQRAPMLKDRSGLGLVNAVDALTIVYVSPGSPAAAGDWKAGERIIAIDGVPIDKSYMIDRWRWRFDKPGRTITLTVASGEQRRLVLADYY